MPRLTALIDGDILLHTMASIGVLDFGFHTYDDAGNVTGDVDPVFDEALAKQHIDVYIARIKSDLDADGVRVALSDPSGHYFRHDLYPKYKNRRSHEKPMGFWTLRDYVVEVYKGVWKPGLEADDILGIWGSSKSQKWGKRIVVSIDKDMQTIPCTWYNPKKMILREISQEEADYFHLFQTLTGDTTDDFPGCRDIGKVRAKKRLDQSCSWNTVVEAFREKGKDEAYALTQARLARLLRTGEYNGDGEIALWRPQKRWTLFGREAQQGED